jgi:GNAT superfamily N-acetyltransferase
MIGAPASPATPAPPRTRGELAVRPVRGRADLDRFIRLPFRLYVGTPQWVPPLVVERRRHLDRRRNPFFEHAEAEYLLAERDGRTVGRISAHVDHRLNEVQGADWGLFGFFECEDDPEAAGALLHAAERWLRTRGHERMVGPMDFTTNHECGVLVEGHAHRPQILENWHHPYYAALLEGHGLTKAQDLLKWELRPENRHRVLPLILERAERLEADHGIRVRSMRRRDFRDEVARFVEVYHEAWARNWGFVPVTEREIDHMARELRPLLDEDWCYVAEHGDEVVGASLTLPDYNRALARMGGRLLPVGWLRFLRERRRIDELRVFALGVKRAWQPTGVGAALYMRTWDTVERKGIRRVETGWILESNRSMNHSMRALGGHVVKRWRIYEKPLAPPAG